MFYKWIKCSAQLSRTACLLSKITTQPACSSLWDYWVHVYWPVWRSFPVCGSGAVVQWWPGPPPRPAVAVVGRCTQHRTRRTLPPRPCQGYVNICIQSIKVSLITSFFFLNLHATSNVLKQTRFKCKPQAFVIYLLCMIKTYHFSIGAVNHPPCRTLKWRQRARLDVISGQGPIVWSSWSEKTCQLEPEHQHPR